MMNHVRIRFGSIVCLKPLEKLLIKNNSDFMLEGLAIRLNELKIVNWYSFDYLAGLMSKYDVAEIRNSMLNLNDVQNLSMSFVQE